MKFFYVQMSLVLSEKELTEHRPCCKLNIKSLFKTKRLLKPTKKMVETKLSETVFEGFKCD